ncbi:MAG: hypothetical protein O7E52_09690, partial [Candidatus Poribacteria bacterium]|nr:hypothetical protein [Candidatus Poribacteria bacterium]
MTKLWEWERGLAVKSPGQREMTLYLWFYEWNLFDAVHQGQHTPGRYDFPKQVNAEMNQAAIESHELSLAMDATEDGADMRLTAVNNSAHDWPEVAGIIPCFNPGPSHAQNPQFIDNEHTRTYFLGGQGPALLKQREIHFNQTLREQVDCFSQNDRFVFSDKWPTSDQDAAAGILIRESIDGRWVGGIAWDNFLSAQGHN